MNINMSPMNGISIEAMQGKEDMTAHGQGYARQYLGEHPLCHDCLSVDRVEPANEVHHIKKVKEHPELRLVRGNLMCLCKSCHNRRTSKGE